MATPYRDSSGHYAMVELTAAGAIPVEEQGPGGGGGGGTATPAATSSLSSVNDSASSVMLLSANTDRLAVLFYNDSTEIAYVKFGTTASASSFTKKMLPQELWSTADFGVNYTGRIDAIWANDASGAMRITELSE